MWVCGEVCWNADRSLCKQCAPILQEVCGTRTGT
jgi:hypothetical protein